MTEFIYAGPWLGCLTESSITVKAFVHRGAAEVELLITGDDPNGITTTGVFPNESTWSDDSREFPYLLVSATAAGLYPDTEYRYGLRINGEVQENRIGRFRTLPPPGDAFSFRFGVGACSGNDHFIKNLGYPHTEAFEALGIEPDLLFFCHLGDLHYGNIVDADISPRIERYSWFFEQAHHGLLFSSLPLAYVWDDHDFLGNDAAGADVDSREAAKTAVVAYDLAIPHYPLVDREHGIFQAFTVGRVRFLLLDLRYNRTSELTDDGVPKQILGTSQRMWLESELAGFQQYDLMILCASFPWLGTTSGDNVGDAWFSYSDERASLAEFIAGTGATNLCMLSGDAHMLAIDDGTHNTFAGGRRGFPLFHAASLDSRPSQKGGTYSIGTEDGQPGKGVAGKRQYGVVEVTYDGNVAGPLITWIGRRAEKDGGGRAETVMRYSFRASEAVSTKTPRQQDTK